MRIACLLANDFEDSEMRKPYDALLAAGHEVTIVGEERGERVKGKRGREAFVADAGIDEVGPQAFNALFIPGGYSPDRLRADERFVAFTRGFADKPIFAVCHGAQLLLTADLVRGRKMTAWKTVQGDLQKAGANVVDEPVVVDGNLVTSRQPSDLDAFTRASLELLATGAGAHA